MASDRGDYWVGYKKSVCIVTYKKVIEHKSLNNCSYEESARQFNLLKGEHIFIQQQHELFLEAKRKEDDELINQIKNNA